MQQPLAISTAEFERCFQDWQEWWNTSVQLKEPALKGIDLSSLYV
jgi:hypothetical protein